MSRLSESFSLRPAAHYLKPDMLNWVRSWFKLLLLHLEPFWLQSPQLEQQSPTWALKNPPDFDFYHLPHVTHWLRREHTCFPGRNRFIKHRRQRRLGDGVRLKRVLLPSWHLRMCMAHMAAILDPVSKHLWRLCTQGSVCYKPNGLCVNLSTDSNSGFICCNERVAVIEEEKERWRRGRGRKREKERDTKTWNGGNYLEVAKEREMSKPSNKHKKQSDPRCESDMEPQHKRNGEITYLLSGSPAWIGEEVECCCHGIAACMLLRLVCNHHWCSHSPSPPQHFPYPKLFSSFFLSSFPRLSDLPCSSADTSLQQQILLLTS